MISSSVVIGIKEFEDNMLKLSEKLNKENENKMENLWELIAEKRGLKIGEEFRYSQNDKRIINIIHENSLKYRLEYEGDCYFTRETGKIISKFIAGEGTIEKIPPKFADPIRCKVSEEYKCVLSNGSDIIVTFMGKSEDFYRRKAGNMFAPDAVIPQEQIDKIVKEMKE